MKTLDRLIREAKEACDFREHDMPRFTHYDKQNAGSECRVCQAYCGVHSHPAPNGMDIHGTAVALHCPVSESDR